jgi:hypothetical protein
MTSKLVGFGSNKRYIGKIGDGTTSGVIKNYVKIRVIGRY